MAGPAGAGAAACEPTGTERSPRKEQRHTGGHGGHTGGTRPRQTREEVPSRLPPSSAISPLATQGGSRLRTSRRTARVSAPRVTTAAQLTVSERSLGLGTPRQRSWTRPEGGRANHPDTCRGRRQRPEPEAAGRSNEAPRSAAAQGTARPDRRTAPQRHSGPRGQGVSTYLLQVLSQAGFVLQLLA